MADDFREILDLAKREQPDVPDEVWARFESIVRANFGAQKIYVAARKKGRQLAMLEQAAVQDAQQVADMLGVSLRQARRINLLRK